MMNTPAVKRKIHIAVNTKLLILVLFVCFTPALFAQSSDVDYVEGWVDVKVGSGDIYELFIGDVVYKGETVITGEDGMAELIPETGSRIVIKPGTVFSIGERIVDGEPRSVLSCALGQVSYKFGKMTGAEPKVATPSMICGIRGTEFTVMAAADGSSLIVVDSGAVEVESQGESVLLGEEEGVEVKPGQVPGEKFPVLRGKMDFDQWNDTKTEEMLADPLGALSAMESQLGDLVLKMEDYRGFYDDRQETLAEHRMKHDDLKARNKTEEAQQFYRETMRPLQIESSNLVLNYRYYALAALSLRRHVMTGLYIRMKTHFLGYAGDPLYNEFLRSYQNVLDQFETRVVPLLNENDI